jgi:hypothetical protein
MSPSSLAQRDALRETLIKRAGTLRREIGGALRHANGAVGHHHDAAFVDTAAAIHRDQRELVAIEEALARL